MPDGTTAVFDPTGAVLVALMLYAAAYPQ